MNDYRDSHLEQGRGALYDCRYGGNIDGFYWVQFEKPYLEALFQNLGDNDVDGKYLDFAVGTARIMEVAAEHFDRVVGIDVSAEMVKIAREKCPNAEFVLADVTSQPVDVGRFSTISAFRFFLNADDPLRDSVLGWMRGVIEEDGRLVINNHGNRWSASGLVSGFAKLFGRRKNVNLLSDREIRNLLTKNGFEISSSCGFRLLPTWRGKLLFGARLTITFENLLGKFRFVHRFGRNKIYVCRPV